MNYSVIFLKAEIVFYICYPQVQQNARDPEGNQ